MGVTDRNILLFLAQIEEQIEHIVQARAMKIEALARRPNGFQSQTGVIEAQVRLIAFLSPPSAYTHI